MCAMQKPGSMASRVRILGIAIDNVVEDEALEHIASFIAEGGPHQVSTANPEFLMEARRNPAFRAVLQQAALVTPDGFGLLLAARWLGTPLRGRVTGVELTLRIAERAARLGWRIFLLGAAPGVAEHAAQVLQERYAGLRIAGCYAGSPQARHAPFLRQVVGAAQPDVLLVAYGHPAQDLWIAHNQPQLAVPVAIGVGGTFDYLAGRVPRAPTWLRRLGLEWLYRLARQPQRWRRILTAVPHFIWVVVREGQEGPERRAGIQ